MLKMLFLIMMTLNTAYAGHEFSYTYTDDQTDIKIFEVDSPLKADIRIFISEENLDSTKCWLKEDDTKEDNLKVLKVDEPSLADIKVYFVNSLEESSDRCY